ncbi:MAG: glycosyltransferase family 4 protein [Phycisphaeraceae bacterium]|nr:MAG: glycosyltransferase family 4 protein [Phycisphaeraceae bacterium]
MRLLTIVRNLGPGGTQRSAQSHAECYADAGVDSAVFAYEAGGPRLEQLRGQGIEVFVADETTPGEALRAALAWRPDAVHVHRPGFADPTTDEILAALRDAGTRAVVETNHFARADRSPQRRLIDVHVQLSRWCLWQWHRRCRGLSPAPVGIAMPHIIRADRFGPVAADARASWRAEHGIPSEAVVFGRVAQPLGPKWSRVLFEAFGEVARERDDVWLVTVGLAPTLHAARDRLPESIRRRIVSIDFLHGDAALRACYGSIDVFAHAAKCGETFGMVICEAALAGVPTVTLSTPLRDNSQIEVVGHERGGLVAGDGRSFADAMRRLAREPETRVRLGHGAADWVRQHCDGRLLTGHLLGVFDAVLSADRREQIPGKIAEIPGLTRGASTAQLMELLAPVPGANALRDRALLAASTVQAAGRIKQRLMAALGRGPGR